MKKFLCVLLALMLISSCLYAADVLKVGQLAKLNISPEDFKLLVLGIPTAKFQEFRNTAAPDGRSYKFYNSLMTMLMGLNRGEIDEIHLPKDVANYVVKNNDTVEVTAILKTNQNFLAIGFHDTEKGQKIKSLINNALITLENNGKLANLKSIYITDPGIGEPEPVKFEKFDNAETIKVAVTGDMPPIDFIDLDGDPAGFNTAVLAEAAKIAGINIELVNIDSSARAAALVSGRVDAVFWFQIDSGFEIDKQPDLPEGIILSEPYYSWDEIYALKIKAK
ncbi:MAG: transporter substrate-binding domain-containing protein [Synergistaceae bacterium]|nr:transporter substrate-binding domain-containing protein [Synergistaceae bacterium]